jgi:hypothetical protein
MTKMDEIGEKHEDDTRITEEKNEEIVFETKRAGNNTITGTRADSSEKSSSSSSSCAGSNKESDTSSKVVVLVQVIQGKVYEQPDDFPST